MTTTRRAVLTAGVATVAVGTAGVAALVPLRPAGDGLLVLSREERNTVAAAASAWFPGAPFPIAGDAPAVVAEIDRIVAEVLSTPQRVAFRYIVRALQLGTFASRGQTFVALEVEERRAVLRAWADPSVVPRRVALDSLKAVVGMAYFQQPEVLSHIGYRRSCGVPVGRALTGPSVRATG